MKLLYHATFLWKLFVVLLIPVFHKKFPLGFGKIKVIYSKYKICIQPAGFYSSLNSNSQDLWKYLHWSGNKLLAEAILVVKRLNRFFSG